MSDTKLIPLPELIQSLRDAAVGLWQWCVQDPKTGVSCFWIFERDSHDAEFEVRSWFAAWCNDHPNHEICSYEVKRVLLHTKAEFLLLQTADQLERRLNGWTPNANWVPGRVKQFVITLDDEQFAMLSDRERFLVETLISPIGIVRLLIQRQGD